MDMRPLFGCREALALDDYRIKSMRHDVWSKPFENRMKAAAASQSWCMDAVALAPGRR
jgi:hypothetical protein